MIANLQECPQNGQISPLYRTDAKLRAEGACTLCRSAKEEDEVKGGLGDR